MSHFVEKNFSLLFDNHRKHKQSFQFFSKGTMLRYFLWMVPYEKWMFTIALSGHTLIVSCTNWYCLLCKAKHILARSISWCFLYSLRSGSLCRNISRASKLFLFERVEHISAAMPSSVRSLEAAVFECTVHVCSNSSTYSLEFSCKESLSSWSLLPCFGVDIMLDLNVTGMVQSTPERIDKVLFHMWNPWNSHQNVNVHLLLMKPFSFEFCNKFLLICEPTRGFYQTLTKIGKILTKTNNFSLGLFYLALISIFMPKWYPTEFQRVRETDKQGAIFTWKLWNSHQNENVHLVLIKPYSLEFYSKI